MAEPRGSKSVALSAIAEGLKLALKTSSEKKLRENIAAVIKTVERWASKNGM